MIVEDTPSVAESLCDILVMEGYDTTIAPNGAEAISVLMSNRFDLVITDIVMPVMDGEELVKKMRANTQLKDVPVILLSAKVMENQGCMPEGDESQVRQCFLEKTGDVEFLLLTIKKLMS
jgi:CheY-like chemotaxis protein